MTTPTNTDPTAMQTKSGKGIEDFTIPPALLENDMPLVELIIRSESMNDNERQYWFNLTEVMTPSQVEKLRGILTREKEKLEEIEKKYGPKQEKTPEQKEQEAKQAQEMAQMRQAKQREIQAQEKEEQENEKFDEDALLGELDDV